MPRFQIAVEVSRSRLLAKTFEAATIEEAKRLAEHEAWEGDDAEDWNEIDSGVNAAVREDQCRMLMDEPVSTYLNSNPPLEAADRAERGGVTVIEETTGHGW